MGERFDRLRYEVFQNLFLSPMNTGSVRPAVATTPTARGIETLQIIESTQAKVSVATTPTARGIETFLLVFLKYHAYAVATTPTARGIETRIQMS